MERKFAYSIGSILMSGLAFWLNPLSSKPLHLLSTTPADLEKKEDNNGTKLGFPHESMITLDSKGNIIIAHKTQPHHVRAIHPTGQLSPVLGSLQEAGSYFSPGSGGGQEGAAYGYGYGAGGGYPAYNYNGGDFSSGAASKIGGEVVSNRIKNQEMKDLPEGKPHFSSAIGNTNSGLMGSSNGATGNSGFGGLGSGLGSGGGFASGGDAPGSSKGLSSGSQIALASPGSLEPIDMSEPVLTLESSGSPTEDLSFDSGNSASAVNEVSGENEPDFIPVTVQGEKAEKKSDNAAKPMQAPDRRNNAGNAEDSAKNAIPPILMNADDEKKKADEERQKQNYAKANEHDSKAAMLLAQAAAMAAAMAGNNNAKNKADSRDGQSSGMQPLQIPNFNNPTQNESANTEPRTVYIPNPNKQNRSPASSSSSEAAPVNQPQPIYIR